MNKKLIFTLVATSLSTSALAEGINLNPVVVTATRSAQNSFDLPVSIDAVDAETLHDSRVMANLSEVSARIPGVVINNRYNSAQELAISTRGFGARSLFGVKGVRIYADGIPLTTPDGQGQLGALSLDTAGQVEFMRGPFSALYGNSSGGVVQTITRDGAKDTTISGGITAGSFGTVRESLTAEGQSSDLNYIINVTNLNSDGYRDHSKFKKENMNAKLVFKISDDTKLSMIANYMEQPYTQDPQALSPLQFNQNPKQSITSSYTGNTRVIRDQTYGGIVLDHNINESQSIRLMTYYGERNNLQYLTTSASGYSRTFNGVDARWTLKNELFNRPLNFSVGVNYDSMTDDDRKRWSTLSGTTPVGEKTALTRDEVQKAHNFDQFAQITFEPTDRWLLLAGLRHSDIKMRVKDNFLSDGIDSSGSVSYSNTSPALGATFKLTPALNVYANYGEGFETPTFAEMSYSIVTGTYKGAGPNLTMQPSKSKNYEVGAKAFLNDNTRVNLALFKVNAKNEITVADNNSTDNITAYKSVAETERKGIELSIDSRLPYNFNFYGAYTLMDAAFTNSFCAATNPLSSCPAASKVNAGNKIPGTYTSTQYSELTWKHPKYGFSTGLEAIYQSSTNGYDTNDSSKRADSFYLFNYRAGLTQNLGNWKINEFFRVDNMFDEKYVANIKVNSGQTFEPGQGRSYTIGVGASYVFK